MKLFVPACGDRIVLSNDWTFALYNERRNWSFMEAMGIGNKSNYTNYGQQVRDITLAAGTVLECDRIYIRAFSKSAKSDDNDFDSITWRVVDKKKSRFWAKLKDCNNIEFTLADDANFKERKKAEEEFAATQPKKLTASIIRDMFCSGNKAMVTLKMKTMPLVEALFEDSERVFKESYDEYVMHLKEMNEKAHSLPHSWHLRSYIRSADIFKPLQKEDFLKSFFNLDRVDCKFSRRGDGTGVRKFSWPWYSEPASYWSYDMMSYALQGLFVNVISNADDTEVIGFEVCDKRTPKKSK